MPRMTFQNFQLLKATDAVDRAGTICTHSPQHHRPFSGRRSRPRSHLPVVLNISIAKPAEGRVKFNHQLACS